MITKAVWKEFIYSLKDKWLGDYTHSNSEMASILLLCVGLTPLVIVLDVVTIPIQILYCASYKIIKKVRSSK